MADTAGRRSARTPATRSDKSPSLSVLRRKARACRACPLWKGATQTVFGEGPASATVIFVGEQPGDREDLMGKPFVGPAGRLLDRALAELGIERGSVYVTNAVKHFKFELRGKRRIHKKPNEREIAACHQWLDGELRAIHPGLIVALGTTAARAIFGRATAIERNRGKILRMPDALPDTGVLVTVHPSFLLRVPEADAPREYRRFVADLALVKQYV
jgi:uracil-DNA glycosylase family protein